MQVVAQEDIDVFQQEHAPDDAMLQELCNPEQDWTAVVGLLPQQWRAKARSLGAVRRQLRGFDSIDTLFRVLLSTWLKAARYERPQLERKRPA